MTTQNHTASPTSSGMTTMLTITQEDDTMMTGTTPSQSHTATHPAVKSTPSTPSGTTVNTTVKVSANQTVMTATPQRKMTTDNVSVMSHPSTVTATSPSQPVTSTSVPYISTILAPTDISTIVETNLCSQDPSPCDTITTDCIFSGGIVTCSCRSGYINSRFSNRGCTACPSGEKEENGNCVVCPFGYAGFNCNDSSLLALVVISCVLGGLLFILLLAFVIYCCRRTREEPNNSSPYPAEDFEGMWSNKEVLPIPRASLNWDSTQIEMTKSGNHAPMAKKNYGNGVHALDPCCY
ncbi:hypothetical protein AAFF_G00112340 [Aldrovandia affinis]|uniref:Uncharacterized protein n=1 Tax=Aldrovandia affinis TaxID=143900 RepID=A0AAD7RT80_9TELE|nr:hypothetical protein AAFF_G00112340 [Aldrovandia affinis]